MPYQSEATKFNLNSVAVLNIKSVPNESKSYCIRNLKLSFIDGLSDYLLEDVKISS